MNKAHSSPTLPALLNVDSGGLVWLPLATRSSRGDMAVAIAFHVHPIIVIGAGLQLYTDWRSR